ncbi:D-aminoacylase [Pseudomonas syringae pv. actinidiae]|nr:D-aminoacylase [Pseudomonas syringae pv. actinidiae]NVL34662.1 D-aminoacylase [Pseudomonas syringae pv. actinidiae]
MADEIKFDVIIGGGVIIDGTRSLRYVADIGITGGKIAMIGDLSSFDASESIDATGKIVAPGFIDAHTHDDEAVLSQPEMTAKISQGVTTVITGNCGVSIAPLNPEMTIPSPLDLISTTGEYRFPSFSGYVAALRAAPPSVNVAPMVGHSTLRVMTMSSLDRAATSSEIDAMRDLLDEAMTAGALGVSTGTYYPLAADAPAAEIVQVCSSIRHHGAVYATHLRDEADHIVGALEETFQIGKEVGARVIISHHKLQRPNNFGRSAVTLPMIEAAMKCQCIGLDCYPYNASSTMIHADPKRLQGQVLIASSDSHPDQSGRDLDDIAKDWGVDKVEAARRLQPGSAIYFGMDEGDVQNILAFDHTMIGSDGVPTGERPHPRLWGTFPRVLGHYSRDLKLFSLETAVWKMTGLTAKNFSLKHRGTLEVGSFADVVLFDAINIKDAASYEHPMTPAEGIDLVMVNGEVTWRDGVHLGARAGTVITRAIVPEA